MADLLKPFKFFYNYAISPAVNFFRFVCKKVDFLCWTAFPSRTNEEEKERYNKFINALGGWSNVSAFSCRCKSWHFKIIHSFLIDWDSLNLFNVKIMYWSWPYLDLSLGSYSKWIFKRLKKFTNKPGRKVIPKCSLKRS